MAKCPKCSSRKGKRPCPALGEPICSVCCGEHRLRTIPCPQDCPHLESEFYQQTRRRERAAARGRAFMQHLEEAFPQGSRRELAFLLQADIYHFGKHGDGASGAIVSNAAMLEALEQLETSSGPIVIPPTGGHPLGPHLAKCLEHGAPYARVLQGMDRRDLESTFATLRRRVQGLGAPEGAEYQQELARFFDELDFEADLDYDPSEAERPQNPDGPREPPRTEGGLILPS